MKVAVFDSHAFEKKTLREEAEARELTLTFFENRLNSATALLARGFDGVLTFVNDQVDAETVGLLKEAGVRIIATRSAGFNHIDHRAAQREGIPVVRVPEYSPYAVAEFAAGLLLSLNRKIHKAYLRTHELNFSLDGLVGFDLHGKTVGVIGTGRIGQAFACIMRGFGCRVLAHDMVPKLSLEQEAGIHYTDLETIWREADVISLHIPLTPETRYLIDEAAFAKMKPGAILINTGRGALIRTSALIQALKARRLGGAALDVYEEEEGVFFQDLSESGITDDVLARLLTFPNVLVTSHQAFLTQEALRNIAETTMQSLSDFFKGRKLEHQV